MLSGRVRLTGLMRRSVKARVAVVGMCSIALPHQPINRFHNLFETFKPSFYSFNDFTGKNILVR
jgi:hypothetical protein